MARHRAAVADLLVQGIVPPELDVVSEQVYGRELECTGDEAGGADVLVNNAGFGATGSQPNVPAQTVRQCAGTARACARRITDAMLAVRMLARLRPCAGIGALKR